VGSAALIIATIPARTASGIKPPRATSDAKQEIVGPETTSMGNGLRLQG
jgi:hypothetical protein